jgi:hypothetical protein
MAGTSPAMTRFGGGFTGILALQALCSQVSEKICSNARNLHYPKVRPSKQNLDAVALRGDPLSVPRVKPKA